MKTLTVLLSNLGSNQPAKIAALSASPLKFLKHVEMTGLRTESILTASQATRLKKLRFPYEVFPEDRHRDAEFLKIRSLKDLKFYARDSRRLLVRSKLELRRRTEYVVDVLISKSGEILVLVPKQQLTSGQRALMMPELRTQRHPKLDAEVRNLLQSLPGLRGPVRFRCSVDDKKNIYFSGMSLGLRPAMIEFFSPKKWKSGVLISPVAKPVFGSLSTLEARGYLSRIAR